MSGEKCTSTSDLEPCNLIGPLIMSLGIELINYLIGLFIKTMYIETKQQQVM